MNIFRINPFNACLSLLLGVSVCSVSFVPIADANSADRGVPGRREGAGTRGNCMSGQTALTTLAPFNQAAAKISTRSIFGWHVPASTAQKAEFTLIDGNDKAVYKTTVKLTGTAGIVKLKPPANSVLSVLEPGKKYYWQFSVICDPNQPSKNPFVEGVVQKG